MKFESFKKIKIGKLMNGVGLGDVNHRSTMTWIARLVRENANFAELEGIN